MTRVRCCVPFCRRTTKPDCDEWICGPHWKAVPKSARRVFFRVKRLLRQSPHDDRAWARHNAIWQRVKRHAIERAMGIGS